MNVQDLFASVSQPHSRPKSSLTLLSFVAAAGQGGSDAYSESLSLAGAWWMTNSRMCAVVQSVS